MARAWWLGLVLLLLAGGVARVAAQSDDDGAAAAARNGKVLDLHGKILDIVGVSRGLEGTLKDLNAKATEKEIRIALSGDVLFAFDKATLRPDALVSLQKVAEVIKGYPGSGITVDGYTDAKGGDAYNKKLSEGRAETVRAWLVQNAGVAKDRVAAKGWGKANPVAPNTKPDGSDDPEGRQKNRRVEITIKKA